MGDIIWDDSYSIHHDVIDAQHKKWIEIYNRLHHQLLNMDGQPYTDITLEALEEMVAYTKYHFDYEHEYMKAIDYPDVIAHVRTHKLFDTKVYGMYRDVKNGEMILNSELMSVIRSWLLNHIVKEDIQIAVYAQKAGFLQ